MKMTDVIKCTNKSDNKLVNFFIIKSIDTVNNCHTLEDIQNLIHPKYGVNLFYEKCHD